MANQIPKSYDPLVELMEDAADGAATHGASIGLKQNTEAAIRADLVTLAGRPAGPGGVPAAVAGLKSALNGAKSNKTAKTAALRNACSNGRALAMACTNALKPVLGNQWNSAWNAAGFTDGSLAIPANPMVKLQQLRAYFLAHPSHEVPNVNGIACTAAACETAAQAVSTAQSESNQSNTDAGTAQSNLETGIEAGRRRMGGLRDELSQLISDSDERWYAFGFDRPSDPSTPEVPENLTVTAGAPGSKTLFVHCDDARRAETYRFRVANTSGSPLTEELVSEPEAVIDTGLTSGSTVNVSVSARNSAGESQPTAVVSAVVP